VFARCDRAQLRRIVRWGELVDADAGRTLVRQGGRDYWFFVVLSGQVRLSRSGRPVATLGAGGHFGEGAIVGFRPQPVTAVTSEACVLFVLGPRYLLSLLSTCPPFQMAVFPEVAPEDFAAFAQRMLTEGGAEWRRTAPPPPWTPGQAAPRSPGPRSQPGGPPPRPPGRTLSLREAVALLSHTVPTPTPAPPEPSPTSRSARVAAAAGAAAVLGAALFGYHPPIGVVSAGAPIDVTGDIAVTGAPVHRSTGHYLLLWVRETRPDLAGALLALASGRPTLGTGAAAEGGLTPVQAERLGRQQYLDSQRTAVQVALATLGISRRGVSVRIRDRGLTGPSAGLVYALAVADLLGGHDLARGRTVAATGELEADGGVDPVGWVSVKAKGAESAGATVLILPEGQQAGAGWPGQVASVSSLRQALSLLGGGSS